MLSRKHLKRIPGVSWANSIVRSRLQERHAARSLAAYRARTPAPPNNAEVGRLLRARLASRGRIAAPRPRGALHIFLAAPVVNWEAILARSLEPFGRVTHFDWRALGFDDRADDWVTRRDAMNAAMRAAFDAAAREQPMDAVVGYLSGRDTSPETLHALGRGGTPVFNFCWDDKLNWPGRMLGGRFTSPAAIAGAVDLNLTSTPSSIVKYAAHGGLAIFWPEAAHPDLHRPHDVPFEFDVGFIGARYGWRPRFLRALERRGVAVACFGRGWPRGTVGDEEMVQLYSRCRINLGFGGIGHSRRLVHLKGRDFEVPMSGGLYLTQDNPELALVYRVGEEILTYRDEADCAATIRALLAAPERASAIRAAGHARARGDHSYERRWERIFRLAGILDAAPAGA